MAALGTNLSPYGLWGEFHTQAVIDSIAIVLIQIFKTSVLKYMYIYVYVSIYVCGGELNHILVYIIIVFVSV